MMNEIILSHKNKPLSYKSIYYGIGLFPKRDFVDFFVGDLFATDEHLFFIPYIHYTQNSSGSITSTLFGAVGGHLINTITQNKAIKDAIYAARNTTAEIEREKDAGLSIATRLKKRKGTIYFKNNLEEIVFDKDYEEVLLILNDGHERSELLLYAWDKNDLKEWLEKWKIGELTFNDPCGVLMDLPSPNDVIELLAKADKNDNLSFTKDSADRAITYDPYMTAFSKTLIQEYKSKGKGLLLFKIVDTLYTFNPQFTLKLKRTIEHIYNEKEVSIKSVVLTAKISILLGFVAVLWFVLLSKFGDFSDDNSISYLLILPPIGILFWEIAGGFSSMEKASLFYDELKRIKKLLRAFEKVKS